MSRFCFEVYRNDAPLMQLPVPLKAAPSISWTADAEIKRTISITCPVVPDIDWVKDELQASMETDGGKRLPLGRFIVTTSPRQVSADGVETWALTGYDYGYKTRDLGKLEHSLTVTAGTQATQAVTEQLLACNITRILLTSSEETLSTDHVWEAGASRYDVIRDLLEEINYRNLWFDGSGNAVIEPWQAASVSRARHRYDAGSKSVVTPDFEVEDDIFDAANVFIELVSSADAYTVNDQGERAALRAESVNNNPDSRISVIRRGMRVPSVEVLDTITSPAALQVRADNRKLQSMMGSKVYSFYTGLQAEKAEHGLNDSIILDRDGVGLLEEQDWSISCTAGGLMTHTARKAYYI